METKPIVTISEHCPFCGLLLDGLVFASFRHGELSGVSQTKRLGKHEYTWSHTASGCRVPALDRIVPEVTVRNRA